MAKIFVTRMLTRDLFAVANLVVGDDVLQHVCADRSADNYMSAVSVIVCCSPHDESITVRPA